MYSLTLTADERRAFDWVGSRYNSGKVADLLVDCMLGRPGVGRRNRHHLRHTRARAVGNQ